jgi:Oxidoreductase molybdopterin binding domain
MNGWFRALFFLSATAVLSAAEPVLKINAPAKSLSFTSEEFASLPHQEIVALEPHGKKEHRYSGVAVADLLARAEAPLGEKLRGQALQLVVVVHSKDGYAVVFSLAEFDEAFGNRAILLADHEDGQLLPENAAPFRLVVAGDKRAARWARMVSSIDLVAVTFSPASKP